MERVKITRTIVYTAFAPRDAYPGLTTRDIVDYEKSLQLSDAIEVMELVSEGDNTIHMSTVVEFEVTSDR